jgi:hypothetical protein
MPTADTGAVKNLRSLSPYLFVELLLPGGTLIALLLWLFRRKFAAHGQVEQGVDAPARVGSLRAQGAPGGLSLARCVQAAGD